MKKLILKKGREKSLRRHHPWVYSGSIAEVRDDPLAGETVRIESYDHEFLAWGAYSPNSKIRARVWSWNESEKINRDFFERKIIRSAIYRNSLIDTNQTNAFRLVYAESDGLPGLILDRYGDVIVLQSLSWGVEYWLDVIADIAIKLHGVECIYERSDSVIRKFEGLESRGGLLRANPQKDIRKFHRFVNIFENEVQFLVDIENGHKTGFYLDQRNNRQIVQGLSPNKHVLDCFCYTGGFTLNALHGGASSVTAVDESSGSLDILLRNLSLNNLPENSVNIINGDVFQELRRFRDEARQFDVVILDPPKFAPTTATLDAAARGYKDINLLALKLLRSGGLLTTFSCSGGINMEHFQKIVAGAAIDANRDVRIVERLSQSPDHPVVLNYPEGYYLKGFVLLVE